MESNPVEFAEWVIAQVGEGVFDALRRVKEDTTKGKYYKRTAGKGQIAKYFRGVYQDMLNKRDNGETGRIDFAGWL